VQHPAETETFEHVFKDGRPQRMLAMFARRPAVTSGALAPCCCRDEEMAAKARVSRRPMRRRKMQDICSLR
jgi:hypothetical protein